MELFDQAAELHKAGKFKEAEEKYDMLLTQNHNNPGLLATVGTMYLQMQRPGLAIHFLERAVELKLDQSDVLSNLSLAYKNSGQREKAFNLIKKACEAPNPCAGALANFSGFHTNTGTPDKAIEICRKALVLEPEMVVAHWNLGLALLEKGQWEEGWEEHEWGLKGTTAMSAMRVDRKIGDIPMWDGTPGKTVVVYGEQGLGDEIMFASMIPDLMSVNNVILESHKRLVKLFEKSFGVKVYGTREDTSISWPFDHQLDYRISIGSLGKFFRRKAENFPGTPYLKVDDPLPKGEKFRIGISWTGGGPKHGRVITRSVPLSWWQPILEQDCESVEFVSLQYTNQKEELQTIEALGHEIKQYDFVTDNTLDYYETARLVSSCDLVISCCTAVIHLAGALGVPCWVMVPNKPAWRYGVKGPMPWYRSVRLYRQNLKEPWTPVIAKIAEDLKGLLEAHKQRP